MSIRLFNIISYLKTVSYRVTLVVDVTLSCNNRGSSGGVRGWYRSKKVICNANTLRKYNVHCNQTSMSDYIL